MAEALNGGNLELIHARAHFEIPGLTDDVVTLADDNIGFAFAPALEIDAYLPGANPLAFDNLGPATYRDPEYLCDRRAGNRGRPGGPHRPPWLAA